MIRSLRHPAFTLLELVLVMVILCAALAMAAPSLRGWSRGASLRDAADEFLAVTRWARAQAAAEGAVYRLTVDAGGGGYRLSVRRGDGFTSVASGLGKPTRLPRGFTLAMIGDAGTPLASIDAYPTGRMQPARVRITADQGDAIELACEGPAEPFRVVVRADAAGPGGAP